MKPLTLAIISLLFITLTADAQNVVKKTPKLKYTKQGIVEVGGEIFFTSTLYHLEQSGSIFSGYEVTERTERIFTINANAGYFVIEGLKIGVEPALTIRSGGGHTSTQQKIYLTPEYVFKTKTILYPYIGASIGYTSVGGSGGHTEGGFSYGAKGGVKINALGSSLLNVGISFYSERYDYNNYVPVGTSIDVKQRYDIFGVTLGWSVFF